MAVKTNYIRAAQSRLSYWGRQVAVSHEPRIHQIESTNHCNLKCPMCPQPTMKRPKGFMDFELFKKIIVENKRYIEDVGLHHFGEALIHPKIVEMVEFASANDIYVGFSTNVALLKRELSTRLLKAGLRWINLDFDSFDKATFEKFRVNAKHEQVLKNINDFLAEKEALKSKVEVTVQMIRFDDNKAEYERFFREWRKKGVNHVHLQKYITYDKNVKSVATLVKDEKIKASCHRMCYYPWRNVVVLWDGRVVPCCGDYEGRYIIGSLEEKTLMQIWNSDKMVALRQNHIDNDFSNNELCKNCTSFDAKWPFNR